MAIKAIYKKYFQKSKIFIYPLLDIKRGTFIIPNETYLNLNDTYSFKDMKLICLYEMSENKNINLNKEKLLKHNRLFEHIELDNDSNLFIFDFSDLTDDWQSFTDGKYSKLNEKLKRKILNYFDKNSGNYAYVKSYLYPEDFFNDYAILLNVDNEMLEKVGELCDKPDLEKETLTILINNVTELKVLK
jgi:hypothetical protein